MRGWDNSPVAKAVGGYVAREAGKNIGYVRAAGKLTRDAAFLGRLVNPLDSVMPGPSAKQQLARGGVAAVKGVVRDINRARRNPVDAGRAVVAKVQRRYEELEPSATPQARTFAGEVQRNLAIGANRGEMQAEVWSNVAGGPGFRLMAGRIARQSRKIPTVQTYLDRGYDRDTAKYFAEPYIDGMGHHFIPRGAKVPEEIWGVKVPKRLVGRQLPRDYIDSRFNVLKPKGLTKGEFFEHHFRVDPSYRGGNTRGRGRWSGEELGWEKYGLAGRLWHGSPGPLKDAVWITGSTPIAIGRQVVDEETEP